MVHWIGRDHTMIGINGNAHQRRLVAGKLQIAHAVRLSRSLTVPTKHLARSVAHQRDQCVITMNSQLGRVLPPCTKARSRQITLATLIVDA